MISAKLNKRADMRKLTNFAYFLMMKKPQNHGIVSEY